MRLKIKIPKPKNNLYLKNYFKKNEIDFINKKLKNKKKFY